MALGKLSELDPYCRAGYFPEAWEEVDWARVLWGGQDNTADAMGALVQSCDHSLLGAVTLRGLNMPASPLSTALYNKLSDPDVFVQLVVNDDVPSTVLGPWPNSSVAKFTAEADPYTLFVIDSTDVVTMGSAGELLVLRDATFVAYYTTHLAQLHTQALALEASHDPAP